MKNFYEFVRDKTEFHVHELEHGHEFVCLVSICCLSNFHKVLKESFGLGVFDEEEKWVDLFKEMSSC